MLKGHESLPKEETILVVNLIAKEVYKLSSALCPFLGAFNLILFFLLVMMICFLADRKDKDLKKRSSKKRKVPTISFIVHQYLSLNFTDCLMTSHPSLKIGTL